MTLDEAERKVRAVREARRVGSPVIRAGEGVGKPPAGLGRGGRRGLGFWFEE